MLREIVCLEQGLRFVMDEDEFEIINIKVGFHVHYQKPKSKTERRIKSYIEKKN
jgi:hypothetical protein